MNAATTLTLTVALMLSSTVVSAKRTGPQPVPSVLVDEVEYRVPHFGALHGKAQNGGFVQAWDIKSNRLLWDRPAYVILYDQSIETDVQDVFITSIQVVRGKILVTNDRAEKLEMDIATGAVRALTPLGAGRRLPGPPGKP